MVGTTVDRALAVLCSEDLADVVEMVLRSPEPGLIEARSADGAVRFRVHPDRGSYTVEHTEGRDPLSRQDPTALAPLKIELGALRPAPADNCYPLAFERIAQVFDHPCAPDLYVLHTAAKRWEEHLGEHGSLGVVQSRAPFIARGGCVRNLGMVDEHCRMVDVAPTVLSLLGLEPALAGQDGQPLDGLRDPASPPAEHVMVVLFDGANANVLYDAAANGELPNVAGLIAGGTAYAHGLVASLPTVTLPNHTTLMTGAHPGHHGVLHNAWYDRQLGRQVVTESPATWQEAMRWLRPGFETIHEAVHRQRPGAVTVAVNEPADRGADYSTMDLFRTGRTGVLAERLPRPYPHADEQWLSRSSAYRWGSAADASAVDQAAALWAGELLGTEYPLPTFCWVSFSLTDSAFHEGGPHSPIARAALRDSDARLGELLEAVRRSGAEERTAVLLVADHGMEQVGEERTEGWGPALQAAGIPHRDEASGFLYLTE